MKELSLNILDIAMNSVKAQATEIGIELIQNATLLTVTISDNGHGISEDNLKKISDPFFTTRTTRDVGLGIPFYILAARQTGGDVVIKSVPEPDPDHGTVVTATFYTDNIDCMPLGDMVSTVITLIQGSPDIDFEYHHKSDRFDVNLSTKQIRAIMDGIPLDSPELIAWIKAYLESQYNPESEM